MRLNKRKCRKFADPDLKMKAGSSILHAEQIDNIILTAIKIIDHHKTLILYIYSRAQAAQGDFRPLWTIFQTKDDFITLERQEDGRTVWRTAAFWNLGDSWDPYKKCAFYSLSDELRLCRYLKVILEAACSRCSKFRELSRNIVDRDGSAFGRIKSSAVWNVYQPSPVA